jgi:hypothetical protein
MKWPIIYTFLATLIAIFGVIEKRAVYLITAFCIYIITIIWLLRKKSNPSARANPLLRPEISID